jgi:hypothetical protein
LYSDSVAFFWSPDSNHIAIYSRVTDGTSTEFTDSGLVDQAQSGQDSGGYPMLRIQILTVEGGTMPAIQVADTFPTRGQIEVLGFFDQYSRAVSPWSPDGTQLVYTSVSHITSRLDLVVATLNKNDESVNLNRVAEGVVAFWSPR